MTSPATGPALDRRALLSGAILLVGGTLASGVAVPAFAAIGTARFFTPEELAIVRIAAAGVVLPGAPAQIEAARSFDAAQMTADPVYRRFKELVLTLYYLSQPGATRELRYEHVPGKWEPSIEVGPDTRAWAV